VITNLDDVRRCLKKHHGKSFAFDVETSGLDYLKDRVLGLALSFDQGPSVYLCIEHTVEDPNYEPRLQQYLDHAVVRRHAPLILHQFMDRDEFVRAVQPLFDQTDVEMVAHNLKFDLHFLSEMGVRIRGRVADTQLAAVLLDENRSTGLKKLAYLVGETMTEFTELDRYEGFGKEEFLGVPLDIGATYAVHDTGVTWKLWRKLAVDLSEDGLEHAFCDIWMPLCVTLQQMERKGIALDMELVKQTLAEAQATEQELSARVNAEGVKMVLQRYAPENIPKGYLKIADDEEVEEAIVDAFGTLWIEEDGLRLPLVKPTPRSKYRKLVFNTGSTKHMTELLFEHYRLKPPGDLKLKRTQSGEYSVDRNTLKVLDYMLGEKSPQVLKDLLAWRKANKFITAFLHPFVELSDPNDHYCLRTSFRQDIAATGRLSSQRPNLQQIPSRGAEGKKARSMFVARPGHKLIVADYAAMELRVAAHYSQDETMVKAFADGLDLHAMTASTQSGIPYEELLERIENDDVDAKLRRTIGKVSNFGLLYGMAGKKFQVHLLVESGVRVSLEEADALIAGFNTTYEGMTEWKQRVIRYAKKVGYIQTIGGRKRRLPELWSDNRWDVMRAERQAVNAIIQGSCADIVAEAIPAIQQALEPFGAYMLLQVHDEVVAEAPEENADEAAKIVQHYMTSLINPRLRVPLAAEAGTGYTWGEAK
jgi:DNA polymerase-1